jgi:uncharacterized protein YggE
MNDRTIIVTGVGSVSEKPDMIRVSIEQKTQAKKYAETMEKASEELEEMRKAVAAAGLDPAELKTGDFGIETRYERRKKRGTKDEYERYLVGYECWHNLAIEFPNDMERLGKVLSALAACEANPEFSTRFFIKDGEALKNRLLENAVTNAVTRANVMAKAAGVKLGELLTINYSWSRVDVYSETKFAPGVQCLAMAASPSIEPENVEASDNVTIVWAIE